MLFSYKIFTFSHLFSQLPNKFYNRKFQNIHLTQQKIKIKTFIHNIYIIYSLRGGRKSQRLRERERSEWMEDSNGQIRKVWGWSGDQKKKNWPPSSDRIPVVKELERDGLREKDG